MNSDPIRLAKPLRVRQLLTLDILALLILVPAHILGRDDYLSVIALLTYLIIALWLPLPEIAQVLIPSVKYRISFILRYALILTIATSAVLLPTLNNVLERFITPIEADGFSPAYSTLSDSALQTELGLANLASGANPYEERYEDTPLRFFQWLDAEDLDWHDPAYEYFVYLPANLLLSYPFYDLSAHLSFPYDQRIIFLLFYVILLFVLPQLVQKPIYKLTLVAAVALNPLLTEAVVLGMNDIVVFLALTLAILFLNRQRWGWSFLFMGLACALKQYAWFIAPFYLLYVWQASQPDKRLPQLATAVGVIGGVLAVTAVPFIIWNPQAFYTDVLAFPAGRANLLYPIRGFTVGRLLMGAGIIPTFVSPFPFQLLQAIIGLPAMAALLMFQYKRNLAAMIVAASLFVFCIGFLSRFFHHNYVGIVTSLATLGILLDWHDTE
ncbi:MAG: DUF2029 domain-containing protein [Chloroflexi bacterium]|nr:DUF2029 domain-containing protein [Chloroflexota bacterium]